MNMTELGEIELKYLGAFLHDIGKLAYRADFLSGDHEKRGADLVCDYLLKEAIIFCGLDENRMVENLMDPLKVWEPKSKIKLEELRGYISRVSKEIRKADEISAKERVEEEKSSMKTRRPLVSIFSKVSLNPVLKAQGLYYYEPKSMEFEVQFPKPLNVGSTKYWELSSKEEDELKSNYFDVLDKFLSEGKEILKNTIHFRPFFTTLFKLFERHLTYISSAGYVSSPDISLFDHSRSVAALTLCLLLGDKGKECLFIKGDLSGIQKFIFYEIEEAERAARQLRGRSFYVKLLTDTVANYLAAQLGVYDANILFCSGGHFLILVPNNEATRTKLDEAEKQINKVLLKNFGGVLQFVFARKEFKATDVENFERITDAIEFELQKAKLQKSFSILDEILNEPLKKVKSIEEFENLFIDIGTKLVQSDCLVELHFNEFTDFPPWIKNYPVINFKEFGITYLLVKQSDVTDVLNELKNKIKEFDYCIIHNLKDTDLLKIYPEKSYSNDILLNIGFSFKFVGSYIPQKDGTPLTFERIASGEGKEDESSFPMLGVAKMDVDNLGLIFSLGLKSKDIFDESLYSISRYAMLSRELDHFFCGHINSIARDNNVYLVYSGGDDLFAVGRWIDIIDFVKDVNKKFTEFTCHNPNFTISCGTVVVKPKYPVAKFADDANNQLEEAKKANKNKISIFYRVVNWKQMEEYIEFGDILFRAIVDKTLSDKLPRSFIHNLLSLTQQCFDEKGNIVVEKIHRFSAKLHYSFARRKVDFEKLQKHENEDEATHIRDVKSLDQILRKLARKFIEGTFEERKTWVVNFQIPASYVILKSRMLNKNRE